MKRAIAGFAAWLCISPAWAADVAAKPDNNVPPPLLPVLNWTGWYIGANAGYGRGAGTGRDISVIDPLNKGFVSYLAETESQFPKLKPGGFIGGGQVGYDWQGLQWIPDFVVVGVVADFQGADIADSGTAVLTAAPQNVSATLSLSEKLSFLGTVRGRLGVAVEKWLLYGSGGLAYGRIRSTLDFASPGFQNGAGAFFSASASETKTGWAAGGGVNYALTPNWILGVDYLHYDLGRASISAAMPAADQITTMTASQSAAGDIVRAVVNYRF